MTRRLRARTTRIIPIWLLVLALSGCSLRPDPPANVIVISLDTLRADRLGFHGYERETSPQIDAFAARSVVFSNAVTQFTTTHYSHQVLFSGRYAFRRGTAPSLAQLLQAAGLQTAGLTSGGLVHRDFGFAEGFDEYRDDKETGGFEAIVPAAVKWLGENRAQPFFLFLHTYDVHCPYAPPEPYASQFQGDAKTRLEFEGTCGGNYFNDLELSPQDVAELSARYDGGVRWVDDLIAPLFEAFERLAIYDDTLIVLTSDHGEALGEDGFVGHGRLSEAEVRVPLIVWIPGEKPKRIDAPVSLADVVPTILAQLGVQPTLRLDGSDLTPLLRGRVRGDAGRFRLTQSTYGRVAFRAGDDWLLITRGGREQNELYDLRTDPRRDVIDAHPKVARELVRRLRGVIELEPGGRPFRKAPTSEAPEALRPALRRQLEALGYVE